MICKQYTPFPRLPFNFVDGFLCFVQTLIQPHLFVFTFCAFAFHIKSKKPPQDQNRGAYSLCFLLALWLQVLSSLIYFELIFIYSVKQFRFYSFACCCPVYPAQFIEARVLFLLFSSSPLSAGNTVEDPKWIPKTMDNTKLKQAYLGDNICSMPDYYNKVKITMKRVTPFLVPQGSYVYTMLQSIKYAIVLCLNKTMYLP